MLDKQGKMIDRREMLKVKVASLGAESRIIRRAETRYRGLIRAELVLHRVREVRRESRCSGIAYGVIRGRRVQEIEMTVRPGNELTALEKRKIATMISRYGPVDVAAREKLLAMFAV